MGMRRNIAIKYAYGEKKEDNQTVYFYTHWGAEGLEQTLATSLTRGRERWDDESYLARIIFSDMIEGQEKSLTGYGIAPYPIDEEYPTLNVDVAKQTVNDVPFEDFLKNPQMFAVD
jgi:hypothetical protein